MMACLPKIWIERHLVQGSDLDLRSCSGKSRVDDDAEQLTVETMAHELQWAIVLLPAKPTISALSLPQR